MQNELLAENSATIIRLCGINRIGSESGNDANCAGRDLPWLQDTNAEQVWADWGITYRDVVIADETNARVDVYNLTENDLADPVNYAELKARLKQAAGE